MLPNAPFVDIHGCSPALQYLACVPLFLSTLFDGQALVALNDRVTGRLFLYLKFVQGLTSQGMPRHTNTTMANGRYRRMHLRG